MSALVADSTSTAVQAKGVDPTQPNPFLFEPLKAFWEPLREPSVEPVEASCGCGQCSCVCGECGPRCVFCAQPPGCSLPNCQNICVAIASSVVEEDLAEEAGEVVPIHAERSGA